MSAETRPTSATLKKHAQDYQAPAPLTHTARMENFVRATRDTVSMDNVPLCHSSARQFGELEVRERIKNASSSSIRKASTPDTAERIVVGNILNVTPSKCNKNS